MIDAARRASAGRITAVIPYYAYGRTDKKDQAARRDNCPPGGRLHLGGGRRPCPHHESARGQIQGFFNIPVDELDGFPLVAQRFREKGVEDLVVVAPDIGRAKTANDIGELLDAPIAIIEKERVGNDDKVRAVNLIGNVEGKNTLIVDDEINTGGTIVAAADMLKAKGANDVYCCTVHPVFSGTLPSYFPRASSRKCWSPTLSLSGMAGHSTA